MTNLRLREPCADFTTLLHQVLLLQTGIKSYFNSTERKEANKSIE